MAMPRFSQTLVRACFLLVVLCDVCARLAMAQSVLVPEGACVGYENTLVRTCGVWGCVGTCLCNWLCPWFHYFRGHLDLIWLIDRLCMQDATQGLRIPLGGIPPARQPASKVIFSPLFCFPRETHTAYLRPESLRCTAPRPPSPSFLLNFPLLFVSFSLSLPTLLTTLPPSLPPLPPSRP